jgi:hypothetical protein
MTAPALVYALLAIAVLSLHYLVEVAAEIERDACCADARQMDLKVVP